MKKLSEIELIAEFFSPLSNKLNGRNLLDDAALIQPNIGKELIVTTDTIIQGVHFIGNESPQEIAKKALRVNLSDIAAMGAVPNYYMLAISLPKDINDVWLKNFSEGLAQDQKKYSLKIIGGDTVFTPGPLTITITCFGEVLAGKAIGRNGAKVGDDIFVSGSIGNASLGLDFLQGKASYPNIDFRDLVNSYRLPEPRCNLAFHLTDIANSASDISDGLVTDMKSICDASGVGARIELCTIPTSKKVQEVVLIDSNYIQRIITGGDDYEILFTANPINYKKVLELSLLLKLPINKIGTISRGNQVLFIDENKNSVFIEKEGFKHR